MVAAPSGPKLNVGCGSDIREDYLNVDARELPGVDVVADVRQLPFEPRSVDELYASHTIEHFREHQLRGHPAPLGRAAAARWSAPLTLPRSRRPAAPGKQR